MKITPLELRQFEFEKTFRGYSIEEVDMFINNLAQEWERVLTETKMMRMQLELAEKEANKLREIELTLFKTLKTAEDTSTMITEQASQQAAKNLAEANEKAEKQVADAKEEADKYVYDAKAEAERILTDARTKANETLNQASQQANQTLNQANEKAKYVKEDILSDVRAIESDFNTLVNYKEHLLTQMRGFASATIEHVERFESKFDIQAIESKINKANEFVAVELHEKEEIVTAEAINKIEEAESPQSTETELVEFSKESVRENEELKAAADEEEELEEDIEDEIEEANFNPNVADLDEETIEEIVDNAAPKAENPYADEEAIEASKGYADEEDEVVENYEDEIAAEQPTYTDVGEDTDDEDELEEEQDYSVINSIKEKISATESSEKENVDAEESYEEVSVIPSSVNKLVSEDTEYTAVLGDDLTRIEGIGPKVQDLLKDVGIRSFRDIATTPLYKIKEHLRNAGSQYNMLDASTWTEQALLAAEGRWDELEVRQNELIGGRDVDEKEVKPETFKEVVEETPRYTPNYSTESNLENITEEMLEKVNKVKSAIRKAMSEKKDKADMEKEGDSLPTLDDVLKRNRKKGSGSFFDNID